MEAAVSFHLEMHKLRRVGRCLKVLNRRISETQEYESEEGVANLPRVQRRYLLKSMEVGLRRSERNHTYLITTVREEVSPARGKPDPYFYKVLLQWYTETAQEAADVSQAAGLSISHHTHTHLQKSLAEWVDPVVGALEALEAENELCESQLTNTGTSAAEKPREFEVRSIITCTELFYS